MAKDYLEIGASPCGEMCVPMKPDDADYDRKARIECNLYIEALRKKLGNEPTGARLYVKRCEYEPRSYYEVACEFDDDIEESVEYAFKCESDGPEMWADVGMEGPKF